VKSAPETSAAHAKDQVKTAPEKLVETRAQEKPTQGPTAVPAPAAAVAADATIVTTIVLAGFDPDEDDEILLCGASELLGDWDPARAKPMARAGDQWLAQLTIPAGTELAFKFIRRSPDGDVTWEPGDDRTLVAKPRIEINWLRS
jgi:hypothetical protein